MASLFSLPNIVCLLPLEKICTIVSAGDGLKAEDLRLLDTLSLKGDKDAGALALVQLQRLNPPLSLAQYDSVVKQYKVILPNGENARSFTDPVGSMAFMVIRPKAGLPTKALGGEQVVGLVYSHLPGNEVRPM